ncbi:MAG: ABC transporter substrate-binding protein, partial [bacterium]|nr:ABC transporter substrate-binding protein [bacterium]
APALSVDVYPGGIIAKMHLSLVRFDENLKLLPDAAGKWEISDDGKKYVFYLRDGIKFSDGSPVSAADVKKSFERILEPATLSSRKWMFENVEGAAEFVAGAAKEVAGIKTAEGNAVIIELKEPFAPFLSILAMPNASIIKVCGKDIIGCGPYKLERWARGEKIVLSENTEYPAGDVHIGKITYRLIPNDFTAVSEFKQGKIDIMGLNVPMLEALEKTEYRDSFHSKPGLNTYYIGFNCRKDPFKEADIRKMFAKAIDKKEIIKHIFRSRVEPAYSPVPPALLYEGLWTMENNYEETADFAAGGGPFKLMINTGNEMQSVAEICQHFWKKRGIEVEIAQRDWSGFKEALNNSEFDMFMLSWWADYPDAENFLYPTFYSGNLGSAGNRTGYSNAGFDSFITGARSETDAAARQNLYRKAANIIVEDAPWIFLWHKKDYCVVQPWVKNFRMFPLYYSDKGTGIEMVR